MSGFTAAIALQQRLGKPLDVALKERLQKDMSITEISEEWGVTRPTVTRLIDYLNYRQYMAQVPRRVKDSSAWVHKQ